MLRRLPAIRVDPLPTLVAVAMAFATLLPARGGAADVLSAATKVAIALLLFLHGARLSPEQTRNDVRQWQPHLPVLAAAFVVLPMLDLVARGLLGLSSG